MFSSGLAERKNWMISILALPRDTLLCGLRSVRVRKWSPAKGLSVVPPFYYDGGRIMSGENRDV